jgi:hypothetical protein
MVPTALLQLQDLAEETFEARSAGCLARVPVIVLSVGTPSGGRFSLIHKGRTETVEPVGVAFETLKYVAHAPLGLFGVLFPERLDVSKPKVAELEKLIELFRATLVDVDSLPVDATSRKSCRTILEESIRFAERAGNKDKLAFTAYARSIGPATQQTMRRAAQVQLEGIETQLSTWKEGVNEGDWARLHAAIASGWARVNNSPRQQAIANVMGEKAARERLFTVQGVKTEEALLHRLAKILNQHDLGEIFFEDRERMDEDLMGRPAQEFMETRS